MRKRIVTKARHTGGEGYRCQIAAILECPVADGCHLVGGAIVGNGLRNDDIARIGRSVIRAVKQVSHFGF